MTTSSKAYVDDRGRIHLVGGTPIVEVPAEKPAATTGYICKVCGAESPVGIGYVGQPEASSPDPACPNLHAQTVWVSRQVAEGVTIHTANIAGHDVEIYDTGRHQDWRVDCSRPGMASNNTWSGATCCDDIEAAKARVAEVVALVVKLEAPVPDRLWDSSTYEGVAA